MAVRTPPTRSRTKRPRGALLQLAIVCSLELRSIGGSRRSDPCGGRGGTNEIPLWCRVRTHPGDWGPWLVGSLSGADASQKVTEARNGTLRRDGNPPLRAKAEGCLTARQTGRAGPKGGLSDPTAPRGRAVAYRIKATPGITGSDLPRVHIDGGAWHLDVGSSHPGAGVGPKGWAVRPLKRHASWVQNVVRQFGLYPLRASRSLTGAGPSTRGPGWTDRWWRSCGASRRLRSYVRKQEPLKASKWEMRRKTSTLIAIGE